MEGEWLCYRGGKFNGGSGHVTEVVTLMEGEWSYYREVVTLMKGKLVMLHKWPV